MTKFKFGDKVWHDEFGVCISHHAIFSLMLKMVTILSVGIRKIYLR